MLVVLNLDSFYTPAKCAFPDGKESWDGGHLTFVCYAMARVDADKEIQLEMSRKMLKLGINTLGRQQSRSSEMAAFAKSSCESDPDVAKKAAAANQAAAAATAAAAAVPAVEASEASEEASEEDSEALGEASTAAAVTLPESERMSSEAV